MSPPINGKQASAAATFEGNPVVPDLAVELDSGGGIGGGWIGSTGSGMKIVTKQSWPLVKRTQPSSPFRLPSCDPYTPYP